MGGSRIRVRGSGKQRYRFSQKCIRSWHFVSINWGIEAQAISEARAALKRTPENAEAHKNMGLAWEVERKFDAAVSEYREALRIKPDYAVVHYDMGILYADNRDFEGAVGEYKKAVALDPGDARYHNNLRSCPQKERGPGPAIREYREAKRLDPNLLSVRNNLASTLVDRDLDAAILEFRELAGVRS